MKTKAHILLVLMFLSATLCFAQKSDVPHGIDLSNEVLALCKSNSVRTETQNLVTSIKNEFPYNISVSFPAATTNEDYETLRNTLLIVISQEDAYKNPELLTLLLSKLSADERDFEIKIILPFGDNQAVSKSNSITGSSSYLASIDEPSKYSCVLVSLDEEKSIIISGTSGEISPTWFVKNVFSAYEKNDILDFIDKNYISYIYKLNLFNEPIQKIFLEAEIPCIKTRFQKGTAPEVISDTLLDITKNYSVMETSQSDYHSIMYSFYGKQIWFTEDLIIKSILVSIFVALLIIFTYGFINESFKFTAWERISKIWHYPFVLLLLSVFIFSTAQKGIQDLQKFLSIPISLYVSIPFVLVICFISVSIAFMFSFKHEHEFNRKTVDYLVLITVIANLFIFCLHDISLFPIFAFEFLLALIATIFKRNYTHLIILVLYTLPFLPFILQILNSADYELLSNHLIGSKIIVVPILLIILPQYLTSFRLFTSFNYYWFARNTPESRRDYYNIICLGSFSLVFILMSMLILPDSFKSTKNKKFEVQNVIVKNDEPFAEIKTNKRYVFGDIVHTINISAQKQIKQCDLRLRGTNSSPILFSDFDYISETPNEDVFLIPYEPPSKMEFSFGESEGDIEIILTVIYSDFTIDRIEVKNLD